MTSSTGPFAVANYLSTSTGINFTSSKWTVAGWFNVDTITTFSPQFATNDGNFLPLYLVAGGVLSSFISGTKSSSQTVPLDTWFFGAATWDSATKTGNLNQFYATHGVTPANVGTHAITHTLSPTTCWVGRYSSSYFLNGAAAYLHIYSRDLSINELTCIMYQPGSILTNLTHLFCVNNTDGPEVNYASGGSAFTINGTMSFSSLGPPITLFPMVI
jgi:hypothetical protein